MNKYILIPSLLLTALSFSSCGSGEGDKNDSTGNDTVVVKEEPKSGYSEMCTGASNISVTIKNYKYQMSSDNYGFETGNFEVKQSNIEWTNDSNAIITLKNYAAGDLVGDRKDDQVDIRIELYARHGKKIAPATYKHSASEMDYSSFTTMTTSKGKVYFNWVLGMDEQGSVKIDYIEGDQACGSFNLAVEKPDNGQIGTVRLSGNFRTE
jgi:hypothetical protein